MTRIAHLSDLHFGAEVPAAVAALLAYLKRVPCDLVVLSGDLTMAARAEEFARAASFIRALGAPVLAVPGNHDISPYRLLERVARPFASWRQHIAADLEPVWAAPDVCVAGLNTTRAIQFRLNWSHGALSRAQIAALPSRFEGRGAGFRVVAAHHPLLEEAGVDLTGRPRSIVRGAAGALDACGEARVDLVLGGHLHRTYCAAHEDHGQPRHKVHVAQAGTVFSARTRGEPNGFNLTEIHGARLTIYPVWWGGARWRRADHPLLAIVRAGNEHEAP